MSVGTSQYPGDQNPRQATFTSPSPSKQSWLAQWYRLTTPPPPAPGASLLARERARRARLASIVLLLALLALTAALPISISNHSEFLPFVMAQGICIFCLLLNRWHKTYLVAALLVIFCDLGFVLSLLNTPLSTYTLPLFDLFALSELIAVSLLPPRSVFLVAIAHNIFIWAATAYTHHTPEVDKILATSGYAVIIRPIFLQAFIAVIAYLWVRSTTRAIERADQAEEIIALQKDIEEQKRQLEIGIQQILNTHVQIANGDFSARAPLTQENALWQIAASLNTMMARLQRLGRTEHELRRIQDEVARLTVALRQAQARRFPIQLTSGGTSLDVLIHELAGKRIE